MLRNFMEEGKFAERYRIDTTRLVGWNYGENGYYFITICAKNREFYFGDVLADNAGEWSVALSPTGKIVRDELLQTPKIRSNVKLDEWVIMPNHVHAIIVIENPVETAAVRRLSSEPAVRRLSSEPAVRRLSSEPAVRRLNQPKKYQTNDEQKTTPITSNIIIQNTSFNVLDETPQRGFGSETPQRGRLYIGERDKPHPWHKPQWQSNSLGSIVNQFKSVCTKQIRKINPSFAWKTRFYDRIIRTERALYAVRQYIKINPQKWDRDRNNPDNLWM